MIKNMHDFYIPVMGTAFTIDTALKVAPYGIDSVVSLVDDKFIEEMRAFHLNRIGKPYEEITDKDEDARAKRITLYLDLLKEIVEADFNDICNEDPEKLNKFVSLLPDSKLKKDFEKVLALESSDQKSVDLKFLINKIHTGDINVNIMTKLNKANYSKGTELPPEFNDALAALRGYANSKLTSSIIFSAGMNPKLYTYLTKFDDFFPDENGFIKKKVVIKVSDFRSAMIQGKFLAKKGIWASEYRIESGLNCGGHAFATQGLLLGPILEEFKNDRENLQKDLIALCNKSLEKLGKPLLSADTKVRVTAQGGVGNSEENYFLRNYYKTDSVGWGSPFLLAPDVVRIDDDSLTKLMNSTPDDIKLSDASPLGFPFWNLMSSGSEDKRRSSIESGKPGSACPKGYIRYDLEFSKKPICRASKAFMKLKLKDIDSKAELNEDQKNYFKNKTISASCICHDLAGAATLSLNIDSNAMPAICSGPNTANFSQKTNLKGMVEHIYGRKNLPLSKDRSHMFMAELKIYIDYLEDQISAFNIGCATKSEDYYKEFVTNLLSGMSYYDSIADKVSTDPAVIEKFKTDLAAHKAYCQSKFSDFT